MSLANYLHHCLAWVLRVMVLACAFSAAAHAQHFDSSPILSLELNKGRLIHLDSPASAVMIANPDIADIQIVSPKAVFIHGRSIGETSFMALDNFDNTVYESTIEVTHNISRLRRTLKRLAPDADVEFKTVDSGIVIEGYADSPQESEMIHNLASGFLSSADEQVLNMITTAGSDQVTLKVKVAEVSRSELERFGINLAQVLNQGNFAFQLLQGRSFLNSSGNVIRNGDDNALAFSWDGGSGGSVDAIIDALETDGFVSILAEPTLTTTTGQTANFLAGGEVPIPSVNAEGQISVEYREFGIRLVFTPTVLSDGKISLRVIPEVSSISSINSLEVASSVSFAVPSLLVRRAETTVELASGQSFAIAGLYSNDRNNSIDKFPLLGDLPVLGALFRSHEFLNDQTELVIIVTPYISKPVRHESQLATPLDGYYPPNDLERIFLGKVYQEQAFDPEEIATLGTPPSGGGFILE